MLQIHLVVLAVHHVWRRVPRLKHRLRHGLRVLLNHRMVVEAKMVENLGLVVHLLGHKVVSNILLFPFSTSYLLEIFTLR